MTAIVRYQTSVTFRFTTRAQYLMRATFFNISYVTPCLISATISTRDHFDHISMN